jgi:hypothetical protein
MKGCRTLSVVEKKLRFVDAAQLQGIDHAVEHCHHTAILELSYLPEKAVLSPEFDVCDVNAIFLSFRSSIFCALLPEGTTSHIS